MLSKRRGAWVAATLLVAILLVGLTFIPRAQASTGKWRNINPTEYTSIPGVRLNSIYVLNGGTGGIGSGNAWAVGNNGTIFNWDGFSWKNQSTPTNCNLHSVNFGGSGIGSGSPPSIPLSPFSSSAGFIVGGNVSQTVCPGEIALFWNGFSWFPVNSGLTTLTGNLTSVFMTAVSGSSVEAWAVGINATAGTTYHFPLGIPGSGGGWVQVPVTGTSTTGCRINSLFMVSTTEGWAAGKCGKIYHYFGGGWVLGPGVPVGGFPAINFNGIFMDSASDGWAVGTSGQISRFTGGIWTSPVTPAATTFTLRSISMVSSSEAWVVGDGATIVHGTSLTGAVSWIALQPNQVPTLRDLQAVHATGGSNVWADGDTGAILEFDGTFWGSITAPLQTNYNGVFMSGDSDAVAVGNVTTTGPTIVRWDGVKWFRPPTAGVAPTNLWDVWELNSGEFWIVGGGQAKFPEVARFSSGALADVIAPMCPVGTPNCVLLSVYGTASNNVWAVGTGGLFAQWTGAAWGSVSPATPLVNPTATTWRGLTFVGGDSNKGWAVGFDTTAPTPLIYCYNNACAMLGSPSGAWTSIPVPGGVPANTKLNSVQAQLDNNNRVWISGSNGIILLINGDTKTITPTSTVGTYNLTSIVVDSSSDGWAVGQDTATSLPVFLHYDGTAWTTVAIIPPFPNVGRLTAMFLRSSTNGFAVGTTAGAFPLAKTLGLMFHLDPPGGVFATTSTSSTPTSSTTSAASTTSSSSSVSASISSTSSTPVTTTSSMTTTVVSTSVSVLTTTVISTPTTITSSSTSSVSTPMTLPAIPGFPWESIIAGFTLGLTVLAIARRRRR